MEVALKVVTRSDASSISAFWTELDALVSLHDPNNKHVVQLLGVCFGVDYVVAVISYHRGGPLSKWWKRHRKMNRGQKVGEVAVARVLQGVGKALKFCHENGRLHLDVKENNVVFGRGVGDVDQVVLIDFGCAVSVAETNGVVVDTGYDDYFEGGTFCCMAPEVLTIAVRALRHERLDDSTPPSCFGAKADVWSLGIMAHVLLTGRYPYGLTGERSDDIEAYDLLQRMNKNDKRVWDGARDRKQLTLKAQNFLSRLLTIDVNERPTLEEAMSDPFIIDNTSR
jgi:serine/threonine protein kinase